MATISMASSAIMADMGCSDRLGKIKLWSFSLKSLRASYPSSNEKIKVCRVYGPMFNACLN